VWVEEPKKHNRKDAQFKTLEELIDEEEAPVKNCGNLTGRMTAS
jgi:hypothetical protein